MCRTMSAPNYPYPSITAQQPTNTLANTYHHTKEIDTHSIRRALKTTEWRTHQERNCETRSVFQPNKLRTVWSTTASCRSGKNGRSGKSTLRIRSRSEQTESQVKMKVRSSETNVEREDVQDGVEAKKFSFTRLLLIIWVPKASVNLNFVRTNWVVTFCAQQWRVLIYQLGKIILNDYNFSKGRLAPVFPASVIHSVSHS